jgi:nanoRNase/pAp phosphatase (c-di-AMP/oligoRNAs hydrolase)
MLKSKFEDLKSYLKSKIILITTHELVDLDGFVSCYLLNVFLNKYFKNEVYLMFPEFSKSTTEFISTVSNRFSDIPTYFNNDFDVSKIDVILILDTNNLDQVNFSDQLNPLNSNIPFIFIDHHLELKKNYRTNLSSLNIIDEDFSSTSEIILELCEFFDFELMLSYKYLLVAAILTDSGFLKHGNNKTIERISRLLDDQLDIQEIIISLDFEQDISEKLAKIKALQRLEILRLDNWLIGITHVNSFEASVASVLINIGCDVSIVYSEKKSAFRISMRAKKKICLETGLHLGKILGDLSEECEGSGGGHDGAASLNGKFELKIILDKIIEKIKQILNQ